MFSLVLHERMLQYMFLMYVALFNMWFEGDTETSASQATGYNGTHMHDPAGHMVEHIEDTLSVSLASSESRPPLSLTVGPETESGDSENDNSGANIGKHADGSETNSNAADRLEGIGEVSGQESTDTSLVRFDETSRSVEAVFFPHASLSSTCTTTSMEIIIPLEDDTPDTILPHEMQDEDVEPLEIGVEEHGSDQNIGSLSDGFAPSTEDASQSWDHSQTIVCSSWQVASRFTDAGGTLHKPGSGVILHVPPGAVHKECSVLICTAVCANVDRINHVLDLPNEDVIVSPFVEYWAGRDFRFQLPVTIVLPHALPPDYDLSKVRVYRVAKNNEGHKAEALRGY